MANVFGSIIIITILEYYFSEFAIISLAYRNLNMLFSHSRGVYCCTVYVFRWVLQSICKRDEAIRLDAALHFIRALLRVALGSADYPELRGHQSVYQRK